MMKSVARVVKQSHVFGVVQFLFLKTVIEKTSILYTVLYTYSKLTTTPKRKFYNLSVAICFDKNAFKMSPQHV
jgi:hypothetical protein